MRHVTLLGASVLTASMAACGGPSAGDGIVRHFPIMNLDGIIERGDVTLDPRESADGNGALKIVADGPRTVRLYEVDDLHVRGSRLVYRARLRAEDVQGAAYLEMWCRFGNQGEYFSRALHAPLSGTTGWVSQETPFFLEEGQRPDHVALNVVVAGSGTVWVDDVALAEGPR